MSIPFIDLQAQRQALEPGLTQAIQRVMDRGDFIQGQEVGEFESALADFAKARHVVSCGNGTDALTLVGMAENVCRGDAIFVPAFTFVATAEAFLVLGAMPYFVDVDGETFNMDETSLKTAIMDARARGFTPKMVVAVDMFGQPANYEKLVPLVKAENMILVSDAAQGLGAVLHKKTQAQWADYTTTSFFPAKPLGCFGDGGAVLCGDEGQAALIKSLTQHGKGRVKYDNVRVGLNSRLDTLQAAVLLQKLAVFESEISMRNALASRYSGALNDKVKTPGILDGAVSVWAQYTLRLDDRDALRSHLQSAGIPSAVYYPLPLNQQSGYKNCPVVPGGVPIADALAKQVLSLPMHAYMTDEVQDRIVEMVRCGL